MWRIWWAPNNASKWQMGFNSAFKGLNFATLLAIQSAQTQHPNIIHSIGVCRMQWFLAVLRSFFHSSLLCTFSCHPSPPSILPASVTSSCHLFLGLPVSLVVPKFIYNTLLGILISSILCTCPNKHSLFNLIVSIIVGLLTLAYISLLVNMLFSLSLSLSLFPPGPKILLYAFLSKCSIAFCLSLLVSQFLMHMLTFCLLLCSLVLILVSLICFYF